MKKYLLLCTAAFVSSSSHATGDYEGARSKTVDETMSSSIIDVPFKNSHNNSFIKRHANVAQFSVSPKHQEFDAGKSTTKIVSCPPSGTSIQIHPGMHTIKFSNNGVLCTLRKREKKSYFWGCLIL